MTDLPPGFLPHDGGPCPVDGERFIDIVVNGKIVRNWPARRVVWDYTAFIAETCSTLPADCRVTAYRVHMSQDRAYTRIAELEAALRYLIGNVMNVAIGLETSDTKSKSAARLNAAIALAKQAAPRD